jgi:rhomboid protease GluP
LLAINITVFLTLAVVLQSLSMDTSHDVLTILHWGSNVNPLTLGGQPWRMVTSMFLHFGIWHLAVNMYALHSLGSGLEPAVGTTRFALIYFACGIVANLFSLALNLFANSAGASGALFGLYGYYMGATLMSHAADAATRRRVLISFLVFVVINGVITYLASVDVWGHIGGFIAGMLLAIAQFRFRLLIDNRLLAVALVFFVGVMFVLPRDQVRYYRLFQAVLNQERITNDYFRHELNDAELLDSLRSAVKTWDSLELAFQSIGKIHPGLQYDTSIMRQYIRVNRSVTDYRVSLLARQSYIYFDSIEIGNAAYQKIPELQFNLNYYPRGAYEQSAKDTTQQSKLVTRRVFFDAEWKEIENPSLALFNRVGQTDSAGRWQGAVRDYYRNGNVQMKGSYVDNLKDGVFLYYSDHNTYASAGRYEREESVGKWESFHWNGKLKSETYYYPDKIFVDTVLDSLGREQVKAGNGTVTSWYANGQVSETGTYRNGIRTGDWLGYHPDGTPYYRELYKDNKLVHGASVDANGKRYVYDELSQYAYPVKGMADFQQYVKHNIRRPNTATVPAHVRVLFQVGKQGDMWDFVLLDRVTPEIEQEAIRLIKSGPAWRQGLLHGHIPIPSQGYAIIDF